MELDYIEPQTGNWGGRMNGNLQKIENEFNNREMEVGTVVLNNTKQYPFTNAEQTITLAQPRDNLDYVVHTEIANADGSCELSPIYDKQLNAFKLNYVGSASAVTVKYYVTGGLE